MPLCALCKAIRRNNTGLTDCPISPCPYRQLLSDNVVTPLQLKRLSLIFQPEAMDAVMLKIPPAGIPSMMKSFIREHNQCLMNMRPVAELDVLREELRVKLDLEQALENELAGLKEILRERKAEADRAAVQLAEARVLWRKRKEQFDALKSGVKTETESFKTG